MPSSVREPGAPVAAGQIPLSIPYLHGNESRYLNQCIESGYVSSVGPFVNRFERMLSDATGSEFAVATCTGTAALHIALLLAGVGAGDEVVMSDLTFIAPANAVRYAGAWPRFIDADPATWQIDAAEVCRYLEQDCEPRDGGVYSRATGRRIGAVLPVHILGHPVDMDPILAVTRRLGIPVIEDATESLGARYRDRTVGQLGDVACFSFNGNKLVTCGGGGMIVTDRAAWAERARYLTTQAKDDAVEFVHGAIGFNYRLTSVQAAVGCAQMEQLESFLATKRRIAARYAEALCGLPGITLMPEAPWARSALWLYTIRIDAESFGMGSRQVLSALEREGIQTRPLWQPLHLSPAHAASAVRCLVAETLNRECLSLPCSVGLTDEEQDRVIAAIRALAGSHTPPSPLDARQRI